MDDHAKLRDQIADAIRGYDWDHGVSANPEVSEHQRGEADAVMAIVRFVTSGYAATTREFRERAEQAEVILRDLVDPDPCYFDHNGFCQAHGYSPPCAHAQARELLAALGTPGMAPEAPKASEASEPQPGAFWERAVLERFVTGGQVDLASVRQQVSALLSEIPSPRRAVCALDEEATDGR